MGLIQGACHCKRTAGSSTRFQRARNDKNFLGKHSNDENFLGKSIVVEIPCGGDGCAERHGVPSASSAQALRLRGPLAAPMVRSAQDDSFVVRAEGSGRWKLKAPHLAKDARYGAPRSIPMAVSVGMMQANILKEGPQPAYRPVPEVRRTSRWRLATVK